MPNLSTPSLFLAADARCAGLAFRPAYPPAAGVMAFLLRLMGSTCRPFCLFRLCRKFRCARRWRPFSFPATATTLVILSLVALFSFIFGVFRVQDHCQLAGGRWCQSLRCWRQGVEVEGGGWRVAK